MWTPHSPLPTTSKATAGQSGPDGLGMLCSPKAGLGYQSWKPGGMSAWLCEPGPHQCMKASLYTLHSPRSRPAFPIGHSLAPAAFLGWRRHRGLNSLFFPNQGSEP